MKEQIETRLGSLAAEFRAGQEMLAELEDKKSNLQITLTRISGAIQVLNELLDQEAPAGEPFETAATSEKAAAA